MASSHSWTNLWLLEVFILCSSLFFLTNAEFNVKPDRIYYVRKGGTATFIWDYTPPSGLTTLIDVWCKVDSTGQCPQVPIMRKLPGDPKPVVRSENLEYFPRTTSQSPYTMIISGIKLSDDGTFGMFVTFDNGNMISDRVRLVVLETPVITKKNLNSQVTVIEGKKTTLDCGASGNPKPLTIEWWFNNVIILTKQTNFELPLVFNSTTRSKRGQYKCIAKNRAGAASYTVNLYINYAPENIQIIPSSSGVATVQQNSNITLLCLSDGHPSPTFSWTRIRRDYREKLTENSLTSKWIIRHINRWHADNYECAATNIIGRKALNVYLDVQYQPEIRNFTINNQNTSVVYVNLGMPVNMTCDAIGNPKINYRIGFQGSANALSITRTYIIASALAINNGVYECIASNGIGLAAKVSSELIVVVKPKEITIRGTPSGTTLITEQPVVLRCEMKGHPRPRIYWTLNRNMVMYDERRISVNGSLPNIGQETIYFSEIRFNPLKRFDDGEYTCFGSNWGGVIERKYALDVRYAPYITVAPINQTIREFQYASLTCRAIGKPPLTAYLWKQNGIARAESSETIVFPKATRQDNGLYTCAGVNSVGVGKPAVVFLSVTYLPEFTVRPILSQVVNTTASVTLRCNATGVPKPLITWRKDGAVEILHIGGVLVVRNIGYKEKGTYTCNATNSVGTILTRSTLLVNHVPVITTTDPASTKLGSDVGSSAPAVQIVCTVNAYPSAVITWRKGAVDIVHGSPGYSIDDTSKSDTSVLTVVMSDPSKRGKYTCTARNKLGSVRQDYEILEKSKPEPPVRGSLKATDKLMLTDPATVQVEIRWVPGYNGGYSVTFYLYYKQQNEINYQQINLGPIAYPVYTIKGLKPSTTYQFTMRAVNQRGQSDEYDPPLFFTTKAAPLKRGSASCRSHGTSGTEVEVTWSFNDYSLAKSVLIRFKIVTASSWQQIPVPHEKMNSSYIVKSLQKGETYEFQVFIIYKDNDMGLPISAGRVVPGVGPGVPGARGLKRQDIIAIVVGVGGFILICIVVLTLVLLRRKKGKRRLDGNYELRTNSGGRGNTRGGLMGYSTVGSDVVRTGIVDPPPEGFDDENDDVDDDALMNNRNEEKSRKESPPTYDEHFSYYDGTDVNATSYPPRNPVGNTPAYSSFSALTSQQRAQEAEAANKTGSRTSLASGRAAEISRRNKTPFDYDFEMDERGNRYRGDDDRYDDERETRREKPRPAAKDRYKYRPDPLEQRPVVVRSSSSGEDDLPSPPAFMKETVGNVNSDSERVPGSLGERMGRNKNTNTLRSSPQHSPSSQRSGASSHQYRSDTEYMEDDGDQYVGYLV
eukprot:gene13958-15414_t